MRSNETNLKQEAEKLAEERSYSNPRFSLGYLFVSTDEEVTVDYCQAILQPRGLVKPGHRCRSWEEAVRLLGMLPPARGVEKSSDECRDAEVGNLIRYSDL